MASAKDYIMAAKIISDARMVAGQRPELTAAQILDHITLDFTNEYRNSSAVFNPERFLRACGMSDGAISLLSK